MKLERKILFLALFPLLGGMVPGGIMIWRAQRGLNEVRNLNKLASLVWKISDLDACLGLEQSNWYFFKPGWVATEEVMKAEREKQDEWRKNTDAAIAAYQQLRRVLPPASLSVPVLSALNQIQQRIEELPGMRRLFFAQGDLPARERLKESYRGFRRDVNKVLPLLVDVTTSDVITRKLIILPKLMAMRESTMEAGGLIFYYHQLRVSQERALRADEALKMSHSADLAELYWADIVALSQGKMRERLGSMHESPEWTRVVELLRGHSVAALAGTEPPIAGEEEWSPSWAFLTDTVLGEINAGREDFIETCATLEAKLRARCLWSGGGLLGGMLLVFWVARRMGRSISQPIQATTERLFEDAKATTAEAVAVRNSCSTVAQGSSRQAIAVQQTSSTLEEISNTTRSNADNAQRALHSANETRSAAEQGAAQMLE
ncbi:MAG: hypothetical protein ABIZ81_15335, partial [Opitutaceae bacterium]